MTDNYQSAPGESQTEELNNLKSRISSTYERQSFAADLLLDDKSGSGKKNKRNSLI